MEQRFPIKRVQVREGTGTAGKASSCVCVRVMLRAWHLTQRWLCGQKLIEEASEDIGLVFCPRVLEAGSGMDSARRPSLAVGGLP